MTLEEANSKPLGLYLIFWSSGGMSKAVLNQDSYGVRMITCHNWVGGTGASLTHYLYDIDKMIFIM